MTHVLGIDWTAGNHEVERKEFIERFQQFARDRSIRISFLGGDVSINHCEYFMTYLRFIVVFRCIVVVQEKCIQRI